MALTVIEYWSLQAFPKLLVSYTLRVDFESLTIFLPSANEACKGYVFTPVCQSFCSQGGLPHCMLDTPLGPDNPPRADTPPPLPPPGTRYPLRTRPPWYQAPPQDQAPPGTRHHPRCSACWEIRATSGQCTSYWNAFLCYIKMI